MTKKWSRFLAAALVVVSTSAMLTVSFDAEARRMGGGSSFGRQSSNVTQKRAVTPPAATNTTQRTAAAGSAAAATGAAAQKSGFSRFLGPIAGIAAGLGIAALLSSMGLGGAFLEFLSSAVLIGIVIFAIMFIVRRLRGGAAKPAMQGAGGNNNMYRQNEQKPMFGQKPAMPAAAPAPAVAPAPVSAAAPEVVAAENPNVDKSWFVPADFDTSAFLQNAKQQFKAIQGIWDKGDIPALKEYLTDDLIAELTPQITARAGQNETEVVLLNAEFLGIEEVNEGHLASVRFSGMLREEANTAAFRFEEVWNLYKPEQGGWLLAGIQQIPVEYAS